MFSDRAFQHYEDSSTITKPCLVLASREKIKTLPVTHLHFHVICSNPILEILPSCDLVLETFSSSVSSTPSQMM